MRITNEQLKQIYPYSTEVNRQKYLPYINEYLDMFEVNTLDRICAFLAQIGHESGQLRYVEEIATGKAYEGRKDLGNVFSGDGERFKGRGIIQITGRNNYTLLDNWLHEKGILVSGVSIVDVPDLLSVYDKLAVISAFWFWDKNNLNRYCTGKESDFKTLTRRINGGDNGYADRVNLWNRAKEVLK